MDTFIIVEFSPMPGVHWWTCLPSIKKKRATSTFKTI